MQYRDFGKTGWRGSALGFGCMRLPVINGDNGTIDEPEAIHMIRHAIDQGVNYVDTAYGYHRTNSERLVGKALKDGYRERVALATKLPCWLVKEASDFDRLLNEQLEKLQTDHIDFYLLHALDLNRWNIMRDLGVVDWLQKTKASGRIRHIGFSFHDKYPAFQQIVDGNPNWEFCQIQYNYMDIENQAGTAGLKYAAARGLGVVVMEPLLGGRLVNPPQPIQAIWDGAAIRRSPADWALQWLWAQPEVSVVLSGMSTRQQVSENLASADQANLQPFSAADYERVSQVRAKYNELCPVPCTHCDYCQPCPNQVNIPRIFELYNQAFMYNRMENNRREYDRMPMEERADMCLTCAECEEKCPQHIAISSLMPVVHEALKSS
jgi:predicted aldo/keto reductase-like oxidoreductase